MSDTVFSARGLLEQFSNETWFPLVLGLKHIVKELIPLLSQLKKDGLINFQRIPQCFFRKLSDYIDITTIYTASDSPNKAVNWLLEDSSGYSSCAKDYFLERYSLAVINFAAPIDLSLSDPIYNETSSEKLYSDSLWIRNQRQCAWKSVACIDGSVVELDLGSAGLGNFISGTIPTEIGE